MQIATHPLRKAIPHAHADTDRDINMYPRQKDTYLIDGPRIHTELLPHPQSNSPKWSTTFSYGNGEARYWRWSYYSAWR